MGQVSNAIIICKPTNLAFFSGSVCFMFVLRCFAPSECSAFRSPKDSVFPFRSEKFGVFRAVKRGLRIFLFWRGS